MTSASPPPIAQRVVVGADDQDEGCARLAADVAALRRGAVEIDISRLPYVSSTTLGIFARLRRERPRERILISGANRLSLRVLSLVGFDRLFEIEAAPRAEPDAPRANGRRWSLRSVPSEPTTGRH
jgi:hypothetical protein